MFACAMKASPPTLHRTSNSWIKVEGEEAVSESHVIAYGEEPDLQRLVLGRYLDRHPRRMNDRQVSTGRHKPLNDRSVGGYGRIHALDAGMAALPPVVQAPASLT